MRGRQPVDASARVLPVPTRVGAWVWVVAAVQAGVLLATSTRYGYHRDEMYFIAAAGIRRLGTLISPRSCRCCAGR